LLNQLRSQGLLLTNGGVNASLPALAGARTFEASFACLRLARVEAGTAAEFKKALDELSAKDKLKGLVVDLRFADGHDYPAAAELADLFLTKAQTLFKLGDGTYRSREKASAISLRCVVLINRRTSTAAEALAGALREAGSALLIGDRTAGRAKDWRSFTLSDGSRVMLAGDTVKLGSGNEITTNGVAPDIVVPIELEEEQRYLADPYYRPDRGVATRAPRPRVNEAALVRERNNGGLVSGEESPLDSAEAAQAPVIRDPVLARALDLLKGLAVVRPGA
jgi:carboxyl-terminal processing protease